MTVYVEKYVHYDPCKCHQENTHPQGDHLNHSEMWRNPCFVHFLDLEVTIFVTNYMNLIKIKWNIYKYNSFKLSYWNTSQLYIIINLLLSQVK